MGEVANKIRDIVTNSSLEETGQELEVVIERIRAELGIEAEKIETTLRSHLQLVRNLIDNKPFNIDVAQKLLTKLQQYYEALTYDGRHTKLVETIFIEELAMTGTEGTSFKSRITEKVMGEVSVPARREITNPFMVLTGNIGAAVASAETEVHKPQGEEEIPQAGSALSAADGATIPDTTHLDPTELQRASQFEITSLAPGAGGRRSMSSIVNLAGEVFGKPVKDLEGGRISALENPATRKDLLELGQNGKPSVLEIKDMEGGKVIITITDRGYKFHHTNGNGPQDFLVNLSHPDALLAMELLQCGESQQEQAGAQYHFKRTEKGYQVTRADDSKPFPGWTTLKEVVRDANELGRFYEQIRSYPEIRKLFCGDADMQARTIIAGIVYRLTRTEKGIAYQNTVNDGDKGVWADIGAALQDIHQKVAQRNVEKPVQAPGRPGLKLGLSAAAAFAMSYASALTAVPPELTSSSGDQQNSTITESVSGEAQAIALEEKKTFAYDTLKNSGSPNGKNAYHDLLAQYRRLGMHKAADQVELAVARSKVVFTDQDQENGNEAQWGLKMDTLTDLIELQMSRNENNKVVNERMHKYWSKIQGLFLLLQSETAQMKDRRDVENYVKIFFASPDRSEAKRVFYALEALSVVEESHEPDVPLQAVEHKTVPDNTKIIDGLSTRTAPYRFGTPSFWTPRGVMAESQEAISHLLAMGNHQEQESVPDIKISAPQSVEEVFYKVNMDSTVNQGFATIKDLADHPSKTRSSQFYEIVLDVLERLETRYQKPSLVAEKFFQQLEEAAIERYQSDYPGTKDARDRRKNGFLDMSFKQKELWNKGYYENHDLLKENNLIAQALGCMIEDKKMVQVLAADSTPINIVPPAGVDNGKPGFNNPNLGSGLKGAHTKVVPDTPKVQQFQLPTFMQPKPAVALKPEPKTGLAAVAASVGGWLKKIAGRA